MLCNLVVIIRNAPGPIRLNRIGSNMLEHLFGKTRLRCRDVSTMKRFLSGLADHFLQLQSAHFLELIAAPKRKTSVGDSWHQSDRSCFTRNQVNIAAFMMVFGISDSLHLSEPRTNADARHSRGDPPGNVRRIEPDQTLQAIDRNRKQATKVLSSNQIFLGVLVHHDAIVYWNGNGICNNH
jgi:hypothetical protein